VQCRKKKKKRWALQEKRNKKARNPNRPKKGAAGRNKTEKEKKTLTGIGKKGEDRRQDEEKKGGRTLPFRKGGVAQDQEPEA